MNFNELLKKANHLDIKYDCLNTDICLLIETADDDTIIAELTDVDVWENDKGEYGLDLIAEMS